MMAEVELSPSLRARFERALGRPIDRLERIGRGYTPALRLRTWLNGGGTVFIKCAVNELTAGWLRSELRVYSSLQAPFMSRMLAWEDDLVLPFLVLEDLSGAFWPPPWNTRRIELVRAMLADLAGYSLPGLPPVDQDRTLLGGWQQVAEAPAEFLALKLASPAWLERALPTLLAVDESAAVQGDALCHNDVRSDNLCFDGERVVLVDWNLACRGSSQLDLACWLPSLQSEGGPPPDTILPGAGALVAWVSGFFACRAGQPIIPDAPRVRQVQLSQLRCALPWAVRALDLPPLDGPAAP